MNMQENTRIKTNEVINPLKQYHGQEIKSYDIPSENPTLQYENIFKESENKMLQHGFKSIRDYFNLPTTVDNFNDDVERQAWRSTVELSDPSAFNLYETNTLRINHMTSALSGAEFLSMSIADKINTSDMDEALKILTLKIRQMWKIEPVSTEEKLTFINNELKPYLLDVLLFTSSVLTHENTLDQVAKPTVFTKYKHI